MERKGRLEVEAGQHTDKGKVRERNEDFLGVPPPWVDSETLQTKGMLYVVADGVGGHAAGLTASRTAVERTVQEYYGDPDPDIAQSLGRAIRVANDAIMQQADENPAFSGMGSTLVAAVLRGDELLVANVGDSRAYLLRGRSTRQISRDHTWVQDQVDAGVLTPEQARAHPKRNVITSSLGVSPDVGMDFFAEKLRAGDTVFLCTDGISGPVSSDEIFDILAKNKPQKAAKRLVGLANERGGFDNSTAVAINVLRTPSSEAAVVRRARVPTLAPVMGGILATIGMVLIMIILSGPPGDPSALAPTTETPATLSLADVVSLTPTISQTRQTPLPSGTSCPHPDYWMPYVIRVGDNISSLADEYGVPQALIEQFNCPADPNKIQAGQTLYLPPYPGAPLPTLAPSPTWTMTPAHAPMTTATRTPTHTTTVTTTPVPAIEGNIAFECWQDIWIVSTDGSELRSLTDDEFDNSNPAWSPDGQRIAFSSNQDDGRDIFVMPAVHGSRRSNLTTSETWDQAPAWSPDGRRIVFTHGYDSEAEVYVINVNGSGELNLTKSPGQDDFAAWSSSGKHLAFASWRDGNAEIYVMNIDGGEQERLTENDSDDTHPTWSPDGRRIAFVSDRDGNCEIYVMDSDGGGKKRLTSNEAADVEPSWSPDGRYIAFASDRDREGKYDIYIMRSDGTAVLRISIGLECNCRSPSWAPE